MRAWDNVSRMYAHRVVDAGRRERKDLLGLGGALLLLVELQERMDSIASSFATKASDVDAHTRMWR